MRSWGPTAPARSTLAQVIAGHPGYEVTGGSVTYMGQDLLAMAPEARAQAGVFLAFQYPVEIPGVSNSQFMRTALNEVRKARGEAEMDVMEFMEYMERKLPMLDMDPAMMQRSLNAGFSGGEKKRNEILQMAVLEPKLAVLDETDSGLDIDALRIVAQGVNTLRRKDNATIVVTHYQRLLNYIVPDRVHVLSNGRIVTLGRQGARARAGSEGLRLARGARGVSAVQRYIDQQAAFSANGGRSAPAWLRDARRAAIARFETLGFPTMKNEDWHFTNAAPIAAAEFALLHGDPAPVSASALAPYRFDASWPTLVFVNGRFRAELSSGAPGAGVRAMDMPRAWRETPELLERHLTRIATSDSASFTALNTAFLDDGAVIHIGADVEAAAPVHLIFVADERAANGAAHVRNLIVAERGAQAGVVESYVSIGAARYFTNAVTELHVGDGATVRHVKVQRESERAYHVHTVQAVQGRDSHFQSFSFASGAALSRTNIYTALAGPGCGATLNGLYMTDGEQHVDHQTRIEHIAPNCFSRELYKGILGGASHGVFNGKVYVHPEAQKTDGKQTNANLLLSERARVDTKPQLEIFADDVKCTHGATVGRLDPNALFYLESRGIGGDLARRLLTYAFAADVIETIEFAPVREQLESLSLARFAGVGAGA